MTTAIDMLIWKGEILQVPSLDKEVQESNDCRERENPLIGCPIQLAIQTEVASSEILFTQAK